MSRRERFPGLLLAAVLCAQPWPPVRADELAQLALLSEPIREPPGAGAAPPSPGPVAVPATVPPAARRLTVVIGGDLGLNTHGAPVEAEGSRRHGSFLGWEALTAGLGPLVDGDLNFANLETVVTARNDLPPMEKAFNFRSHPDGVRHLAQLGFNLLSTANNHAIDFGTGGMRETIANLDQLKAEGRLLAHAGVGLDRNGAIRPQRISVREVEVAFAAVGVDSGGRAGAGRPGLPAWRAAEDVADVIRQLAEAPAQYRILSVHHGQEREVDTDRDTIRKLRLQAVLGGGIDLVVGHHAHVVQGIEITGGRLIFYGLGNLLHPGMQNMGGFGICQDYGLLARIHLAGGETGPLRVRAVEAIPLTDMHWTAGRMDPARAAERVHVLNHLAAALDDGASGARGLRLAPQPDGTGLHCEPGAGEEHGRVGTLCRNWSGVPATPPALKARIGSACGNRPVAAIAAGPRPASLPAAAKPAAMRRWMESVFSGN